MKRFRLVLLIVSICIFIFLKLSMKINYKNGILNNVSVYNEVKISQETEIEMDKFTENIEDIERITYDATKDNNEYVLIANEINEVGKDKAIIENNNEPATMSKAGTQVDVDNMSLMNIKEFFYVTEILDDIYDRICGKSYIDNEKIELDSLRYVRVLHYGFDGKVYVGELIVNKAIADDILDIMYELYLERYPIERMILVDEYNADDELSMNANNTSAFNYRMISGTNKLSNHSYGMAIDINPLYNPYVRTAKDGTILCSPENAIEYADREKEFSYKINHDDLCYKVFKKYGFDWGGDWNSKKDYQHFEKKIN